MVFSVRKQHQMVVRVVLALGVGCRGGGASRHNHRHTWMKGVYAALLGFHGAPIQLGITVKEKEERKREIAQEKRQLCKDRESFFHIL